MDRRQFVMSGTAFAAAATGAEWEGARAEFPWASRETYLNTATEHPLGLRTTQAMLFARADTRSRRRKG